MTQTFTRLALPKLFLWTEAVRFQEYPAALARAEEGRVYTRLEIEQELFDILPTLKYKGGKPRGKRTDGIVNTLGLDQIGNRYCINGINLMQKVTDGFVPTEEGLNLGKLFREDPAGHKWPLNLARQVLLREPRTRLLIGLMFRGFLLQVKFAEATPKGTISLLDNSEQIMVIAQRNCEQFNELLTEHAEMALGPAWKKGLKRLGVSGKIQWEGVKGKYPSTNDLPTALKKSLALLFHVKVFNGDGETWDLNVERIEAEFGPEITTSFEIDVQKDETRLSESEAFSRALIETIDPKGFVIISKLANRFGALLDIVGDDRPSVLDNFVREAMFYEKLHVIERHPGQPRMGRGLFGDNESRLIRFDFDSSKEIIIKQPASKSSGAK